MRRQGRLGSAIGPGVVAAIALACLPALAWAGHGMVSRWGGTSADSPVHPASPAAPVQPTWSWCLSSVRAAASLGEASALDTVRIRRTQGVLAMDPLDVTESHQPRVRALATDVTALISEFPDNATCDDPFGVWYHLSFVAATRPPTEVLVPAEVCRPGIQPPPRSAGTLLRHSRSPPMLSGQSRVRRSVHASRGCW